jgi:NAD(P)-dependent dehydrogenase (short-subunit alcohol dehydrogenase family)
MEAKPLIGKTAIVTGGAGGIGRATVLALAQRGCSVAVVDRAPERIAQVCTEADAARQCADGGSTLALALDVTREEQMQEMARVCREKLGRIDLLVTCAGILRAAGSSPKPMVELSEAEWDAVIEINLKGVFLSNRAVLPTMIQQRSGAIINVSSTSGRQGRAHDSAYCASKFGVIGLSESLAEEVRLHGIKVQVVLPDAVDTPLWDQNGPIRPELALPPERVGDLIAFMACLPADTILPAPVIAPFRTRRRGASNRPAAVSLAAGVEEGRS